MRAIDDWRSGMANELDLVFFVTKFAWPYLAERGGVIINTASTSAYVAARAPGSHRPLRRQREPFWR